MEFRFSAIVIKKTDIGEGDRMMVLYTREAGKVRVMARGVRKSKAKLSAQLENFHRIACMVMRGRGTGNIKSACIEARRDGIREQFSSMAEAFSVADFFDRCIGWEEPDVPLFDALDEYFFLLDTLVQTRRMEKAELLRAAFLFRVMAHLGHGIEVLRCTVSGEKLLPGAHWVSIERGGLVSDAAARTTRIADARRVSTETIKLMRLALAHPLASLLNVAVDTRHVRAFLSFLHEYEDRSFR